MPDRNRPTPPSRTPPSRLFSHPPRPSRRFAKQSISSRRTRTSAPSPPSRFRRRPLSTTSPPRGTRARTPVAPEGHPRRPRPLASGTPAPPRRKKTLPAAIQLERAARSSAPKRRLRRTFSPPPPKLDPKDHRARAGSGANETATSSAATSRRRSARPAPPDRVPLGAAFRARRGGVFSRRRTPPRPRLRLPHATSTTAAFRGENVARARRARSLATLSPSPGIVRHRRAWTGPALGARARPRGFGGGVPGGATGGARRRYSCLFLPAPAARRSRCLRRGEDRVRALRARRRRRVPGVPTPSPRPAPPPTPDPAPSRATRSRSRRRAPSVRTGRGSPPAAPPALCLQLSRGARQRRRGRRGASGAAEGWSEG